MSKRFGLFAFWHYDRFPFCLSARVEEMKGHPDNAFRPEGYGFHWFKMHSGVSLVPEKTGKVLKKELEDLGREYERELKALRDQFEARRQEVFANAGVTVPRSINQIEYQRKLSKEAKIDQALGFREKRA